MRPCDFHLRGNSDLFPGSPIEGFLKSMLEESPRGAVARDGNSVSQKRPWERSNAKIHKRPRRRSFSLRDSPLFQHASCRPGISGDGRAAGVVYARCFQIMRQLHPEWDQG